MHSKKGIIAPLGILLLGCGCSSTNQSSPPPLEQNVSTKSTPAPTQTPTTQQPTTTQRQSVEHQKGTQAQDNNLVADKNKIAPPIAPDTNARLSEQQPIKSRKIRIVIRPLVNAKFGTFYGYEAREEGSNLLLGRAEQVAMEGGTLIVEETQYSPTGSIVYRGRLFFDSGGELVKQEKIMGEKRYNLFQTWSFGH